MKARRGGKKPLRPIRKQPHASPAPAHEITSHRRSHIIADVFIGLMITALLSLANWGLEKTNFGEQLREATYDILELRLMSKFNPSEVNIAVVDIASMPMTRASSHDYDYTKREQLQQLVATIAAQRPAAIGVDVDFTPFPDQMDDDYKFLSDVLALTPASPTAGPGVPIYVATFQSLALGPQLALYQRQFAPLVAYAGFPVAGDNESPKRMVETVDVRYVDQNSSVQSWNVKSLSAAATNAPLAPPPKWASWALDRVLFASKEGFSAREFYVDYGPLDGLIEQTIQWDDPQVAGNHDLFTGKFVFIGRGQKATASGDLHPLPGHRGKLFAGVYIHACAAYTLLHHPLQKLTLAGRWVLDLLLALVILIPVAVLRWRYRAAEPYGGIAHHRLSGVLTFVMVVVAFVAGIYAVNVHHLMWDDSLFVAAAMLIDQKVEHHLIGIILFVKRLFTLAWGLLLFKQDEDAYRPLDDETHGH